MLPQAAKPRSPQRRALVLGRSPWRSIGRSIEKHRAHRWRQEPPTLRFALASRDRRQSRRNDCKEQQARARRHLAVVYRLPPQARRRQQARSREARRSTPRLTRFLGQGIPPAAQSTTPRLALGQQTVRVAGAPSRLQICPGQGIGSRDLATSSRYIPLGFWECVIFEALGMRRLTGRRALPRISML